MILSNAAKLRVLSGFFTNLAAGWFGAVIIFPNFEQPPTPNSLTLLTFDLLFGIPCLLVAFQLEDAV